MSALHVEGLGYSAGGRALVTDASFALQPGSFTMLIGPNGSGKTTLIRLALGLLKPDTGTARLAGEDVQRLSMRQRALRAAYLPQSRPLAWPQPVIDLVALGRFAYGGGPGRLAGDDAIAVEKAVAACRLQPLLHRSADTLSGGELARVHLARAMATEAPLIVADEPAAALDVRYQHEVMQLFANATGAGRAVLAVVHDLTLAARYADRLIWMSEGHIVADGTPADTMTAERLRSVFVVEADVAVGASGDVSVEIAGPAA
ncbi:ABC transporter ATP-binding protein [Pacificimonas flava]|uniref:Vitamin B12 ABC transporter, ATPase component BtuD n=1 Tax=Pacificimonas flava TaxID=1234595 RepID=M2U4F8_9SPHN|nr:ABC transporter ATP-binding protein [Pacificimonas flava]EMD82838.1 Vitamin B12 ABC transporter, ATPase component BtuD [Pacificimonas flava]MBB5279453.1 iron complex transport system ATP-binding protein [Pacificimonas flava]